MPKTKQKTESKWEKHKKQDSLSYMELDEILVLLTGLLVFVYFVELGIFYIVATLIWYWLKIRHYEKKIIEKERDIYNVYYENVKPIAQQVIDRRTEKDRKPMYYDLQQLEHKRKFLVDKFIVMNLILILLVQLFIN